MVRPGLACLLVLLAAASTRAQGLDGQRFVPAAGASSGFVIERPLVIGHLVPGAGLFLNFADDALIESDRATGETLSRPLDSSLTLDLVASLGLYERLELALQLPLHVHYDGDAGAAGGPVEASEGIGDLRLTPIVRLFSSQGAMPLVLGASLPITFPTGSKAGLRGSAGVTIEPRLLVGLLGRRLGVYGNLGARLRPQAEDGDLVGQELTVGAGMSYALYASEDLLDLLVELASAWDLSREGDELTDLPVELFAGVGWKLHRDWTVFGGGGVGVTDGLGTPDFRLFAGLRWTPRGAGRAAYRDTDGDGVADLHDRCPDAPEDPDGFQDADGCPEADNDGDRVPDETDECPDIPEARGDDGDGCPDRGRVIVQSGEIVILGKVQFTTGSAEVSRKSDSTLDEIANALNDHLEIKDLEIQGHTDDVGDAGLNRRLSQARAESIKKALVRRKVAPGRLSAVGHGEARPIAPNRSAAGRAKNRRVEFVVKER